LLAIEKERRDPIRMFNGLSKKFQILGEDLELSFLSSFYNKNRISLIVKYRKEQLLINLVRVQNEKFEFNTFARLKVDFLPRTLNLLNSRNLYIRDKLEDLLIISCRGVDRVFRPFLEIDNIDYQVAILPISSDLSSDFINLSILGTSIAFNLSSKNWKKIISSSSLISIEEDMTIDLDRGNYLVENKLNLRVASDERDRIISIDFAGDLIPDNNLAKKIKELIIFNKELKRIQEEFLSFVRSSFNLLELDNSNFLEKRANHLNLFQKHRSKFESTLKSSSNEEIKDLLYHLDPVASELSTMEEKTEINYWKLILHDCLLQFLPRRVEEEKIRLNGRKMEEIRPINFTIDENMKSILFERGETKVMGILNLGINPESKKIFSSSIKEMENFIISYNFPGFSVNSIEKRPYPSRREINHGYLARKSITSSLNKDLMSDLEIKILCEVLSSDGSTSMATATSISLLLRLFTSLLNQDIVGLSVSAIETRKGIELMADIDGLEDAFCSMDFKIAGTEDTISAIQLDIKDNILTTDNLESFLSFSSKCRKEILEKIKEIKKDLVVALLQFNIGYLKIPTFKIAALIGQGGQNLKKLTSELGLGLKVSNSGLVKIVYKEEEKWKEALRRISEQRIPTVILYKDSIVIAKIVEIGSKEITLQYRNEAVSVLPLLEVELKKPINSYKIGSLVKFKVLSFKNEDVVLAEC